MAAFTDRLTEALDHFGKPDWLGQHSPLASSYFLGNYLLDQPAADDPIGRGLSLQSLIEQGVRRLETIQPASVDGSPATAKVLRLSYTAQNRPSREALAQEFRLSLASYHRERRRAIADLATAMVSLVRPSIRLGQPPKAHTLFERDKQRRQIVDALSRDRVVAISGPSGIGKTVLAASVARQVAPANVF